MSYSLFLPGIEPIKDMGSFFQEPVEKELIRLGKRVRISHLDYDWDLNGS